MRPSGPTARRTRTWHASASRWASPTRSSTWPARPGAQRRRQPRHPRMRHRRHPLQSPPAGRADATSRPTRSTPASSGRWARPARKSPHRPRAWASRKSSSGNSTAGRPRTRPSVAMAPRAVWRSPTTTTPTTPRRAGPRIRRSRPPPASTCRSCRA